MSTPSPTFMALKPYPFDHQYIIDDRAFSSMGEKSEMRRINIILIAFYAEINWSCGE